MPFNYSDYIATNYYKVIIEYFMGNYVKLIDRGLICGNILLFTSKLYTCSIKCTSFFYLHIRNYLPSVFFNFTSGNNIFYLGVTR